MPTFLLLAAVVEDRPTFDWLVTGAATIIEAIGIAVILCGGLYALVHSAFHRVAAEARYRELRRRLGRSILLGLEFLVAADIIATVLLDPSLNNAFFLAIIVLIRTFLAWSLELEIEGRWPWQKPSGNPDR